MATRKIDAHRKCREAHARDRRNGTLNECDCACTICHPDER